MSEILTPIELNDDELLAVSGGVDVTAVLVGVSQSITQEAAVVQSGGSVLVGGGNGATTFTGNLSFTESFTGTITQSAANVNSGSVNATVTASS
jgi:hypothetical protein